MTNWQTLTFKTQGAGSMNLFLSAIHLKKDILFNYINNKKKPQSKIFARENE